jgi:hypothetical protein
LSEARFTRQTGRQRGKDVQTNRNTKTQQSFEIHNISAKGSGYGETDIVQWGKYLLMFQRGAKIISPTFTLKTQAVGSS